MSTSINYIRGGTVIQCDTSVQPRPTVQTLWPMPSFTNQSNSYINLANYTDANGNVGVLVTGVRPLLGSGWVLRYLVYTGSMPTNPSWQVLPLDASNNTTIVNSFITPVMAGATFVAYLTQQVGSQVYSYQQVSIQTEQNPILVNVSGLQTTIDGMASSNQLSPAQMAIAQADYNALVQDQASLQAQATAVGLTSSSWSQLATDLSALNTYLTGLPNWGSSTANVTFVPSDWLAKWDAVFSDINTLEQAITNAIQNGIGSAQSTAGAGLTTGGNLIPNWDSELGTTVAGVASNLVYHVPGQGYNGSNYVRSLAHGQNAIVAPLSLPVTVPLTSLISVSPGSGYVLTGFGQKATSGGTASLVGLQVVFLKADGVTLCTGGNSTFASQDIHNVAVGVWQTLAIGFIPNYVMLAPTDAAYVRVQVYCNSLAVGEDYWFDNLGFALQPALATTQSHGLVKPDGSTITINSAGVISSVAGSGGGTWGSITGTLANQTDLNNALNAKASLSGATFTGQTILAYGGIAGTSPGWNAVDALVVSTGGGNNAGIQIFAPAANKSVLGFSNPTTRNRGNIVYDHSVDQLSSYVNGTTWLTVTNSLMTLGVPLSGTSATFSAGLSDGYATYGYAQINRSGGNVELQYNGGSGNGVRFGGNTAHALTWDGNTGALTGTSASFSGTVYTGTVESGGNLTLNADNAHVLIGYNGTGYSVFGNWKAYFNNSTGALTGTSASFSGQVQHAYANPDVAGIWLQATTGTNAAGMKFTNSGGNGYLGLDNSAGTRLAGVPYSLALGTDAATSLVLFTNNTARLTISSTGASTFSGDVSAYNLNTYAIYGNAGDVHLCPQAGGYATYLNYWQGSGGVHFCNGSHGIVATIDAAGDATFNGQIQSVAARYSGTGGYTLGNLTNWQIGDSYASADAPSQLSGSWGSYMTWPSADSGYITQLGNAMVGDGSLYIRLKRSGTWQPWRTILDTGNQNNTFAAQVALRGLLTDTPIACTSATKPAASAVPNGQWVYVVDDTTYDPGGSMYQSNGSSWTNGKAGRMVVGAVAASSISAGALATNIALINQVISSAAFASGGAGGFWGVQGNNTGVPTGWAIYASPQTTKLADGTTMSAIAEFGGNISIGGCKALVIANRILGNTLTYTSPGTYYWTCPEGVTTVNVQAQAAGGGGATATSSGAGGGGGAGGFSQGAMGTYPGITYTIVVPSGGGAGAAGGNLTISWAGNDLTGTYRSGGYCIYGGQGGSVSTGGAGGQTQSVVNWQITPGGHGAGVSAGSCYNGPWGMLQPGAGGGNGGPVTGGVGVAGGSSDLMAGGVLGGSYSTGIGGGGGAASVFGAGGAGGVGNNSTAGAGTSPSATSYGAGGGGGGVKSGSSAFGAGAAGIGGYFRLWW